MIFHVRGKCAGYFARCAPAIRGESGDQPWRARNRQRPGDDPHDSAGHRVCSACRLDHEKSPRDASRKIRHRRCDIHFCSPRTEAKRPAQETAALVKACETAADEPEIALRRASFRRQDLRRRNVSANSIEKICCHLLLHGAFELLQLRCLAADADHVVFEFEGLNKNALGDPGWSFSQRHNLPHAHGRTGAQPKAQYPERKME